MNYVAAPLLGKKVGQWRAVYWEPVMGSGERLCIGVVTTLDGKTRAHRSIRPGVLRALYGDASEGIERVLEQAFMLLDKIGEQLDTSSMVSPVSGVLLGSSEVAHVDAETQLVDVALLMSSSICSLSDPGQLDASEVASDGGKRINHQFITRIRNHVVTIRPDLAGCFNVEARLLTKKRPVRFGFLSDRLVAHLGVLSSVNLNSSVRNARGLMAEVRIGRAARDGQGSAALILGHQPLTSPDLSSKDRDAMQDCIEELKLESAELDVEFRAADNDSACATELIALQ